MAKMYELWDNANASAIDEYTSLAAALADVRETIAANGRQAVMTWGLLSYEDDGPRQRIAAGDDLIRDALEAVSQPSAAILRN